VAQPRNNGLRAGFRSLPNVSDALLAFEVGFRRPVMLT
jgi:hypothetical protein